MAVRAATRSALRMQKRTLHPLGPYPFATTPPELQEPGPRPFDESMPKFPLGFHMRKREDGRPFVKPEDYVEWGEKFKAWFKEKKGTITDADGQIIELKPYHNYEAYEKFLAELETMSDEEKALKGHTVNLERAKPYDQVFGPSHYLVKEPAVAAYRVTYNRNQDGELFGYFVRTNDKGVLEYTSNTYYVKQRSEAPPARNYLQELEDALASEKSGEKEAEAAA